ncbi:MAG: hypothetical protein JW990_20075 [Thermoleophilia bacterium]|nr:hypothetical protein [Thermoleophilia bacterium]
MNKASSFAILVLALVLSIGLAACGEGEGDTTTTLAGGGGRVLTLDELSEYNGADGKSAYVAVDGVVYDVTGSRVWSGGAHAVCGLGAAAGQDLSEVLTKAPSNMRALLEKMPVVGELAP